MAEWARALVDTVCDTVAAWLHPIAGGATVPLLLITPLLLIGVIWLTARVSRHRTPSDGA